VPKEKVAILIFSCSPFFLAFVLAGMTPTVVPVGQKLGYLDNLSYPCTPVSDMTLFADQPFSLSTSLNAEGEYLRAAERYSARLSNGK
jgi:hypothetical protein